MPRAAAPRRVDNATDKTSGLGVVRFGKRRRVLTIDCWPYDADPAGLARSSPAGPVTVPQLDNYAPKATALLPTLNIRGMKNPDVKVFEERVDELAYALRLDGNQFARQFSTPKNTP